MTEFFSHPIVAAVRDGAALEAALKSKVRTIFLLKGDVLGSRSAVEAVRERGKAAFLHIDLLDGLGRDESAVRFIAREIRPDGIISTRPNLIRCAQGEGLYTVLRVFAIDSQSVDTGMANLERSLTSAVEVLPGLMPKVISRFAAAGKTVISGGLISSAAEVAEGIGAGAAAMSVGAAELWDLPAEKFR